jgi:chromosome partitioning protein
MSEKQTQIIAVMGRKGGITKTTVAANLAAGCTRAGLRTVLVDADGQANACRMVGVEPAPGFFHLILGDQEFRAVLRPVPEKFIGAAGECFILPSDDSQRQVEQHPETATRIYERFHELDGWADVVIVDTSPGITEVHAGFYYAADYLVMPTTLEALSLGSLQSTLAYLAEAQKRGATAGYPAAKILGILPNRFMASEKVEQSNVGFLKGRYGEKLPVFDAIRNLTVWKQAGQLKQSIYAYAPKDDYSAKRQARSAANEFAPVLTAVLSLFPAVTQ